MDDFRAVLRAVPDAYLVLAPDLIIVEASDAYLHATMTAREQAVGRHLFDVFPDDTTQEDADGVTNLGASLRRVLQDRRSHAMAVQRYAIRQQDGAFEERFWKPLNSPVLGADGHVRYIIHRVEDVTEQVRLQREKLLLDRSLNDASIYARGFRQLLQHAADAMVVVGDDGRIRMLNLHAESMFGYSQDELIGQPLEILIPERFRRNHIGHMSRYFASPAARPMASRMDLYARRKDGSEVPVEVSLSPHHDEGGTTVSASIRDVSERRQLESAARLNNERLRSAVESIQDAFALFDSNDRLIMCNSVFRRLVHAASADVLAGRSYTDVLDAWIDDIAFADAAAREEFRAERIGRRLIDAAVSFDVRMRDGRMLRIVDRRTAEGGTVKTIWDLTDDERRAEDLRQARSDAEAASRAKSEFLSSMSHELRTPLNAVLGFAQLLARDRREPLSDRHRERVEHILSGGTHLMRLIDDVLDLSKIEAGRVSISLEPVPVVAVLAEVSRALEPIAGRKGIVLDIVGTPSPVAMVMADHTRLVQILMNFGSNAIKYNRPSGLVRMEVSTPKADTLRITTVDTGMGIPLEKQGQLFQPFQRAGQETGPIEGTGIGLVITRRLAELMQGTVGFESMPGSGSSFWVELPIAQAHEAEKSPIAVRPEVPSSAAEAHLILCVEDNPANVVFMRDLMSTIDNVQLVVMPTAELGIEFARARHPKLVLMDINLPGMSGLDALRVLRSRSETKDIPVIALTAAASERDRQRGLEAGFYRYLSKPADLDELLTAIDSALKG